MWQQSTDYRSRYKPILRLEIVFISLLPRMITCSSIKFSRDQIGYDLRRNESISRDYDNMYSTNMYAKVS